MSESRSRKWQMTLNNPSEHGFNNDKLQEIFDHLPKIVYWCLCDEIGEQDTPHTHAFIICENAIRFSTLHNLIIPAHWEVCKGTNQENYDYIRKEGKHEKDKCQNLTATFRECGELPADIQGKRNDLTKLYDMVSEGMSTYDIITEDTSYISRIDLIDKVRNTILQQKYKNEFRKLYVEYIYGATGIGKTRTVMEKYGYENVYRVTDYDHPFDEYQGEDVILFDEFRSSLKISSMLLYLDGYPISLPARYGNKVACYTKVYIISNLPFKEQYPLVQINERETFNALCRRINYINNLDAWHTGLYATEKQKFEEFEELPI